ncbi:MAG: hypothetical protein COB02_18025 [Candidatus Cloacimonadota bacterium]|nr:MAG: hypothetical protein COB02_18025 [Candidatus Cloacimonadota bacterium]
MTTFRSILRKLAVSSACTLMCLSNINAEINENFSTYDELIQKRDTLNWFSQSKNQDLFKELVLGMDEKTAGYLQNNIYGDYKNEILANYKLKQEELNHSILQDIFEDESALKTLLEKVQNSDEAFQSSFIDLLKFIEKSLKFQAMDHPIDGLSEFVKLRLEVEKNSKNINHLEQLNDFYSSMDKMDIPIWWYDDKNYQILYQTKLAQSKDLNQLNLNSASAKSLSEIEGITLSQAQQLVEFRETVQTFENIREIIEILSLTEEAFDSIKSFVKVETGQSDKKKWTVMVYITASNDLERFGLSDVNEMERIGSSKDVNIVVQLDRIDGKDFHPSQAGSDFIGEGNWSKTRRYYVTKDNNPRKIQSQVLEEIDSVDMGDPKSLSDFAKFSVDKYPAEKYMLVIWNHGAGWPGIAYDDESGNGISMPQLLNSISDISNHLSETQNKSKLDIVNMDACLMAMLEVGYQLKDHVNFLVGSQEVEPGAGMPYGDYLGPLVNHPEMNANALSRNMVDKFVKSYTTKGSQSNRHWGGSSVTQSVLDLSKITPVKESLDLLADLLIEEESAWKSLILGYNYGVIDSKRYATESFTDLFDFMDQILKNNEMSKEIKTAARNVQLSMGVPDRIRHKTDQVVKLVRDKPGYVVWGVNDWKTPSDSVWPRGTSLYRSRYAITPFQKKEDKYVAYFSPFSRMKTRDTNKPFFANEFNYKFLDENKKKVMIVKEGKEDRTSNTIKSNSEYRITQHYKKNSPIVIEGHTQGHNRSYGMSIYLPTNPKKFDMTYKDLDFSKESSWDELISSTPIFTRKNEVLISDSVVKTFKSFQARTVIDTIKEIKGDVDLVLDSQIYEGGYRNIFQQYQKDGIIFTGRPGQDLSIDHLKEVLDAGAKVILYSPSMIKEGIYNDFFKKYLGAEYGNISEDFINEQASREISLSDGTKLKMSMSDLPTLKVNQGKSFINGENGESYGVSYKGKHQLVYLTIPFWSLEAEAQKTLMKEVFAQFE